MLVLGTAGHIDHGKTALVRALTGVDTDRLPVEKARGITTELGFARMDVGGQRVAVVDVPGHERFVKSMVAGATGIDAVVLAVAADEGVMPQTREHLDICDLLGVRRGIVALTKRDLVDDELLALATADVRAAAAETFLACAPIVPVSAKTGAGIDDLRAAIAAAIASLPARDAGGVFRLPIDRVFTLKGFGTIVTGTVLGGEVAAGDEVELIPSGRTVRVRGIEVHGEPVAAARAGQRAALNLGGVAVDEIARGDLAVHPGRVAGSHLIDVELRVLPGATPLAPRSKVLVHHGTAQLEATLVLLDEPKSLAQLRLDRATPLGALPGDRFILRGFVHSPSRGATFAGGRVVRVLAPKANKPADAARIAALADARLDERIALALDAAAAAGLGLDDLVRRTGRSQPQLADPLARLVAAGDALAIGGDHYVHAKAVAEIERAIAAQLAHDPDGSPREALRGALPAALPARAFDAILAGLDARGRVVLAGDRVRSATAPARGALSPLESAVLAALAQAGIEPPRPKELPALLGHTDAQIEPALKRLVAAGLAVKIKPDLVMHASIVADVRARLLAHLAAHATIDAQQWKDLTGASRKFTIPLAEYFDAEKLTLRVGDLRRRR